MQALSIIQIQVGGFDKNFSYLIVDQTTKQAALVDPCGDIERVFQIIEEQSLALTAVLITHTHFDHIEEIDRVVETDHVPVYVHRKAEGKLHVPEVRYVNEGDTITIGNGSVEVLYTPGHLDDSVCYYIHKEYAHDGVPKLITGDTLFVEGCGRTTPSDVHDLYESLRRLAQLPDDTEVYSGHDYGSQEISTIEREKRVNKYLLATDLASFKAVRLPQ